MIFAKLLSPGRLIPTVIGLIVGAGYALCLFNQVDMQTLDSMGNTLTTYTSQLFPDDILVQNALRACLFLGVAIWPPCFLGGLIARWPLRWGMLLAAVSGVITMFLMMMIETGDPTVASIGAIACTIAGILSYPVGWAMQYGLIVLYHRFRGTMPPKAEF